VIKTFYLALGPNLQPQASTQLSGPIRARNKEVGENMLLVWRSELYYVCMGDCKEDRKEERNSQITSSNHIPTTR
jgi:hypothetical protein